MTYRELLRRRDIALMLSVVNISRLASGLIPFGIIAYYTSENDYALAGAASAIFLIVTAISAPAKGRFITRWSPRSVVMPMVLAYGALCGASTLVAQAGAPTLVPLAMIAAGSLIVPPVGALVRSSWNRLAPGGDESRTLHALDSVTEELTFAVAPVLTSVIWVTWGAAWTVTTGAASAIIGTALILAAGLRRSSGVRSIFADRALVLAPAAGRPWFTRLASGLRIYSSRRTAGLLAPMFGLGVAMGGLSLVLPDWSQRHVGQAAFSGILLGVISLSGTVVGALAGRLPTRVLSDVRQYQLACGLTGLAMILFAAADDVVVAVIASVILGAGMTPMFIASFVIVGQVIPVHSHTEVNAALGSGFNLGNGCATLSVGVLIAALPGSMTLAVAALIVVAACGMSLLLPSTRRSKLDQIPIADPR
ncbi:MFS transporter [Leifsonia sp. 2MCAF36]|uniref:MFS transporter n=1 Tax=Leifsonia sp. 2MCAF36 TaxID=3232988 RepID=UPI003F947CD9